MVKVISSTASRPPSPLTELVRILLPLLSEYLEPWPRKNKKEIYLTVIATWTGKIKTEKGRP